MPRILIPPLLLLAACDPAPTTNVKSVDIAGAANQAQSNVDRYAAANAIPPETAPSPAQALTAPQPGSTPTPAPLDPPAPGTPGGLPDDRTPISEAPFTADSAQGAANVVQTYYALLGEGKYARAWALWGEGGAASGMSAKAFANSFAKYSEYHANIGAPGRIDAGAGQRYVTVPVQVYGRLKADGSPFNMLGSITLHRTGEIDGATAAQKSWHIKSADIKPRPAR